MGTHYLNAAALLATLPLMFLDRRYRQRRQVTLFGLLAGHGRGRRRVGIGNRQSTAGPL